MFASSTVIVVIVVCAAVVFTILLVSYMFWLKSKRKVPLPPVQPLAHHRERSLAVFTMEKERERSMYLSATPSWSDRTIKSSPSSSCESGSSPSSPRISLAHRSKAASLSSSAHTSRTGTSHLSRVPHAPGSTIQIILPAPLGASLENRSAFSVVDEWASQAIKNDQPRPIRSRSHSRTQSLPKSHTPASDTASFQSSSVQPQHRIRTRSLPSVKSYAPIPAQQSYYIHPSDQPPPPPVPRIPSMYNQLNYQPSAPSASHPPPRVERPPRTTSIRRPAVQNSNYVPTVPINNRNRPSNWRPEAIAVAS
ncbi:hypothetical protein GYMLUDRAFT_33385 [Collybiopsis luxurians FD-317 M1]|nr:hypothetical protein GYMLUDRAFT_33385 [Collybiopsis luxurians FD-317 M1]